MWLGIALVAFAVTGFLAYLTMQLYDSEKKFLDWSTTDGQITDIALVKRTKPAVSGTATSATHPYWVIDVRYEYSVAGKVWIGNRLSTSPPQEPADLNRQPSEALNLYVQRYPVGTTVKVHYAPGNHALSVLELKPGEYRKFAYVTVAGLVIFVLALGIAMFMRS
jgi:Protein of unknown function (DUF3592)